MAYYNNADDASFYPTSSAFGVLDSYPFLGQMTATEGASIEAPETLANSRNANGQPDYMAGPSTSFGPEASFGEYDCSLR